MLPYDLILAEGMAGEDYPKIVVVRDQIGRFPVSQDGCWPYGFQTG